jgi:DnaJ-class molecular chaperone
MNVKIQERTLEETTCAFCRGTGKDPFGILSHVSKCVVCRGSGAVTVPVPSIRCVHCSGTGAVKTFVCTVCHGAGAVPAPSGPSVPCPECRGSGDDGSAPCLPCLNCHGRGWLTVDEKE